MAAKKKNSPHTKKKTELGKKLFAVRRDMSKELLNKWYVWAKSEKESLTETSFTQLSRGDYISKDDKLFAIAVLKEGKRMLAEYNAQLEAEIASI